LRAVLRQPKRLALLAYLAVAAPRGFQRRDTLVGLLWPELDDEHARGALRQAVRFLRRHLGEDAIVSRGEEEVGLGTPVSCDVVAFEQALRESRTEEALEFYRGDFLAGFFVSEAAPEFDQWVEAERARLRSLAAKTAWARAAEEELEGSTRGAAHWARRAMTLASQDETALRRLISLLDRLGDRAGAVQAYEDFARDLVKEYQAEPSAETQALVEAVRARMSVPGRVAPPAVEVGAPVARPAAAPDRPVAPVGAAPVRASRVRLALAGATAVLLILALQIRTVIWGGGGPGRAESISSVAVLPMENLSNDPDEEYFADGMTDALITELARFGQLRIISRTSVMQYKRVRRPLAEITHELGVDAVVEGTVFREGDRVRITAQLVRGPADQHLWAESFEREVRDVLDVQREIAQAVAREILGQTPRRRFGVAGEERRINPLAHTHYLKGRYFLNRAGDSLALAREQFEQAIALDADFAPAHAGLAAVYADYVDGNDARQMPRAEALRKGMVAARRAVELAPTLAEARAAYGVLLMQSYEWQRAGEELRQAIELNPSDADAAIRYSFYLALQGRIKEAVPEALRARELDPLSPRVGALAGFVLYWAHRFEDAMQVFRATLILHPQATGLEAWIACAYLRQGRYEEGVAQMELAVKLHTHGQGHLAYAYAAAGRAEQARRILARLEREFESSGVEAYIMGIAYGYLGDRDRAFAWMQRALDNHEFHALVLKVEPAFDPLRPDPRFAGLLRRVNLN
jgi:TolB-like protein/DNA-binding SARP family transcriptional activator/tetratricopeptide (TPR) repeat protein